MREVVQPAGRFPAVFHRPGGPPTHDGRSVMRTGPPSNNQILNEAARCMIWPHNDVLSCIFEVTVGRDHNLSREPWLKRWCGETKQQLLTPA